MLINIHDRIIFPCGLIVTCIVIESGRGDNKYTLKVDKTDGIIYMSLTAIELLGGEVICVRGICPLCRQPFDNLTANPEYWALSTESPKLLRNIHISCLIKHLPDNFVVTQK